MNRSRGSLPLLLLLSLALSLPAAAASADWVGTWITSKGEDLPGRAATTVPPRDATFRHVLRPGDSIRYELPLRWGSPDPMTVSLSAERVNRTSADYREGKARFPAWVTVAFGEDRLSLGWKRRVGDFFGHLVSGFPPDGIRLTYAVGNSAPVGSMYRLHEEETVFLVAGEDQAGREVTTVRNVRADFRAAYGTDPTGPVTRILAGGDRPSREEGVSTDGIRVLLPAGAGGPR